VKDCQEPTAAALRERRARLNQRLRQAFIDLRQAFIEGPSWTRSGGSGGG